MRTVFYKLADGTMTTNYTKAVESGNSFKTVLKNGSSKGVAMAPVQKKLVETFGYVKKSLLDGVDI